MPWIESHQTLEHHPKTKMLKHHMGWSLDETIGKLHRFWWWCVDYAEDGDLRRYSDAILADAVGIDSGQAKRFIEGMLAAGWLDQEPYFRVHNWWDYIEHWLKARYANSPHNWMRIRSMYVEGKSSFIEPKVKMTMSEWSRKVRERDGFTCRLCSSIEGAMHAHHIRKQSENPSLIYSIENGVTLCRACHKRISGKENSYIEFFENGLKVKCLESDGKVSGKTPESKVNQTKPNQPNQTNQTKPTKIKEGWGKPVEKPGGGLPDTKGNEKALPPPGAEVEKRVKSKKQLLALLAGYESRITAEDPVDVVSLMVKNGFDFIKSWAICVEARKAKNPLMFFVKVMLDSAPSEKSIQRAKQEAQKNIHECLGD